MYNWSTNIQKIKKSGTAYTIWKLEQMVNFGLDGKKIKEKDFRKYLPKINVDPNRLKLLKFLIKK